MDSENIGAELSEQQYYILNVLGITSGAVSLVAAASVLALTFHLRRKVPETSKTSFNSFPTKILYLTLALSIFYSICYIWSSTPSASSQAVCAFTMTGVVLFLHLMNSTMLLILLHCSMLVSHQNHKMALNITRVATTLSVLASFGFAFAGLFVGSYHYSEIQQTCWIYEPHSDDSAVIPLKLYGFECAILYGPAFLSLVLSLIMFCYIVWRLRKLGTGKSNRNFRKMIIRLGASPAFLCIHCLMIFGGDLPITYYHAGAMFFCFLVGFIGYGSFGLCFAICIIFVDPALATCWRAAYGTPVESSVSRGQDSTVDEVAVKEELEPTLYKQPAVVEEI